VILGNWGSYHWEHLSWIPLGTLGGSLELSVTYGMCIQALLYHLLSDASRGISFSVLLACLMQSKSMLLNLKNTLRQSADADICSKQSSECRNESGGEVGGSASVCSMCAPNSIFIHCIFLLVFPSQPLFKEITIKYY
jgi:hypothetical protein